MPLLTDNTIYKEGQDTTVISSTAPTGAVGFEKDTGQTGFFVYSESPYTLWLKNSSGVWSSHQTFTAGNLLVSSTFAWGEYEAAYLQTAVSDHVAYVYPRTGAILIDGDTSDGVNQADTLLTAGSNTGIGVTTAPIEQFPNWTNSSGHILPDTNATYDIGSAEKKVRHLFLSDNSLWVGDSNKITISNGKIRTTKRKKETPQYILDAGATPQDFIDFYPGRTAASLTVQEWVAFGRAFTGDQTVTAAKMYGSSDFSEDADWEDYLVVDSPTVGDLTLNGTTGQTVALTEIRDAIDNKHTFTDHIVLKEKRDLHFYDETDSMKGQVAYNESSGGNFIKVALEADSTKTRTISLDAGNLAGGSPEGTVKLIGETIINRNGAIYNVTDKLDSLDTSVVSNAAAIAAIDVTTATSFTDSNGNANFSIEQQGNPDAGVRFLKVGADTAPGYDYSGRDSVLLLQGGLPEYNSGMVMLQGKVNIRDKDQNLQVSDVATSINDNTSNITTNADDILSNGRNYMLLPEDVTQGAANPESRMLLMSADGTLYGKSEHITLTTDNGVGLYVNTGITPDAQLRVDGKKLSAKDTVNLLELVKAATEQANDFAHFQALMGLAFANWDPNI